MDVDNILEQDFDNISSATNQAKYRIVNIVSQRVRELRRGAKPKVERLSDEETLDNIALREFFAGVLNVQQKKKTEKLVDIANRED
ncbi:DNA-directed RNA polymerase subunit omega [Candidatus Sumerlaeota bacterium]|nr:DNA-directed RNA polymerase subunit omega [Candidatus Sumerlaeota bacterium]